MTNYVFTSANRAYGPKVAALASSLKHQEPEVRFVWALVEQPGVARHVPTGVDEVLELDELEGDWVGHLRGRPIVEACTAVKGVVLKHLLDREDCESVTYLDPDIWVYAQLTPVWEAMHENSIILTPHMLSPSWTREGIFDNEVTTLKHGVFNLGFIAVTADPRGRQFADWWEDRLRTYCWDAPHLGLFTDQRWVDHVPVFFEGVQILRHEGCNVATWNLGERPISERDGELWAGRDPLVFWHFSSVDTIAHLAQLEKYAQNDIPRRISDHYRAALAAYERDFGYSGPWSLAASSPGPAPSPSLIRRSAALPLQLMTIGPLAAAIRRVVPKSARSRIRSWLLPFAGGR